MMIIYEISSSMGLKIIKLSASISFKQNQFLMDLRNSKGRSMRMTMREQLKRPLSELL